MNTAALAKLSARLRAAAAAPPHAGPLHAAAARAARAAEADLSRVSGGNVRVTQTITPGGVRLEVSQKTVKAGRAGRTGRVRTTTVLRRYLERELPAARAQMAAQARNQLRGTR